jgi:N-acyl-D-amino-acid deacylase
VAKDQSSALLKLQREDGGWAQLPTLSSDAYATGEALCSLYVVGALSDRDEVFHRGIQYLLKSQREDGSWQVSTRSKPIQTYFESGFPHGKSQFISIAGSSWATMALLLSLTGDR